MTTSSGMKPPAPGQQTQPAAPHGNGDRAPVPQPQEPRRQAAVTPPGTIGSAVDGPAQDRLTAPSPGPARGDGLLQITPLEDMAGFRVDGEVDLSGRAALAAALAERMHGSGDIVVDLAGAGFVDVEGLRLLMRAARGLPGGRALVLRRAPPILRRLLEIMNWAATPGLRVEP
jgi:anti-anti-sigma regulatory factor